VVEEELVHMEDAVKLLVDHLVRPVLPRRAGKDERHMTLEKQRAVAQQVSTGQCCSRWRLTRTGAFIQSMVIEFLTVLNEVRAGMGGMGRKCSRQKLSFLVILLVCCTVLCPRWWRAYVPAAVAR
jgi:hypothetical protein